jgi:hypothetical protein
VDGDFPRALFPTGDGVPGGTFESWFRVVYQNDYDQGEDRPRDYDEGLPKDRNKNRPKPRSENGQTNRSEVPKEE